MIDPKVIEVPLAQRVPRLSESGTRLCCIEITTSEGALLCERALYAKNMCQLHYNQSRKGEVPESGKVVSKEVKLNSTFGDPADWMYFTKTCEFLNKKNGERFGYIPAMRQFGSATAKLVQSGQIDCYFGEYFDPTQRGGEVDKRGYYNTYKMMPSLVPDDVFPELHMDTRDLLLNLGGDYYEYLCDWLAYGIQNVGAGSVALVLHGIPGAGKGCLSTLLHEIYGTYIHTVNAWTLENAFNAWIEKRLMIIADEVVVKTLKEREKIRHVMKTYVMQGPIEINRKGVNQYDGHNWTRWIICSNSRQPVDIEVNDRRYSVITQDKPLPPLLGYAITENKHKLAMNLKNWLNRRDISEFKPMKPLENGDRATMAAALANQRNVVTFR